MGYDMYLVNPDPTEADRVAPLRAAFEDACATRSTYPRGSAEEAAAQIDVEAAYEAMDAARTSYHRLNVWGMGRVREAMHALGLLAVNYADHPPFPKVEDFDLTDEQVWESDPDNLIGDPADPLRRFWAAQNETLSWSPPDEPGLPIHKLGSNDGWHVTPRDCTAVGKLLDQAKADDLAKVEAVAATCRYDDDPTRSFLLEFTAWIALAAHHGGFTVR